MKDFSVRFQSPRLGYGSVRLDCGSCAGIPAGVCAVVGPNGAGKTTLGLVLEKGRHAWGNRLEFARGPQTRVKMLAFNDIHSFTGIDVEYFEQRLEATANDLVPTVAEILGERAADFAPLASTFGLSGALDKKLNFLSSGEQRKLLVINALLAEPDILVLDNPYIGLDSGARAELDGALQRLAAQGTDIVLLLSDGAEVPPYADAVIPVAGLVLGAAPGEPDECPVPSAIDREPRGGDFDVAFAISGGTLRYGDKTVASGITWTIRRGERWALCGPNGSGKSLLLSMVTADNPQAYSNHIILFDRPRGSGESIWDIKDRVGYVSPEMQLYFRDRGSAASIVAMGMRRSLDRLRRPSEAELAEGAEWLAALGGGGFASKAWPELSDGERRLTLLARALAARPDLLILDEPYHGLDPARRARVEALTELICDRLGTTLVMVTHRPELLPRSVRLKYDITSSTITSL